MFCEKCGAKLEPDSLFCSTCGAKVITYEDPIPQNNTPYEDDTVRVGEYQDQADPVWNNAPQQPQAPAWNNAPQQPQAPAWNSAPQQPQAPAWNNAPQQPQAPAWNNAPQQPQTAAWNNAPQQPQAPAWNTPSRASAPAGAAGKSSGYTVGLILGIVAYAALILSFFLPYIGLKYSFSGYKTSASFIELGKFSSYFSGFDVVAYVFLAFCIIAIIWLVIPKRWAAIIGAVWSAHIFLIAAVIMIASGEASSYLRGAFELKFGAWLMLIAGIIMLVACIMRAVTVNRRKAAPTYY